ncbi:MAG: class I SAM-dependent rRNA methyltransferase [Treponema sp.]|nr:class I SAM-dependent rRNA methyltransferase [Spirochaetia bacterium]MDD7535194.1 class I SAM-dependent rRNA methyltransferase [Treponema sp.]MDY5758692.1 class I SAM-dependent rRNA methyltransferase [Treponema sp.]MDY5816898.1 class I SAM-dependent rRNA methyltransferase [Treponema sp.]
MSSNNFPRLFLNNKEEKEIQQGFPWVFDNEISHIKYRADEKSEWKNESLKNCSVEDGSVIEVYTKAGGFLGTGVINKKSKITVRLIGNEHADVIINDAAAFYEKRILDSYNMRRMFYDEKDSYRLIFGEADFIPGLISERFCDEKGHIIIVVQFLSLSCEVFRNEIIAALKKVCKPDGIYERSDASVRDKEDLVQTAGWIYGKGETQFIIVENGIKLGVDIANGQKTGYFLDQKFNRVAAAAFCKGKSVLDTFTHTGAFGLNAFKNGAREVTSVDISPEAVDMVNHNIELNNAGNVMKAVCADVFDLLKQYESEGRKFDVIILDPPAFTKSAKMIEKAYGGYKEINLRALRLLNEGGILVTCSCSYFMETHMFCDMLMHAAMDSHKRIQILEKRGAGPDHPVLLGYPKSEYLKCVVCRVL